MSKEQKSCLFVVKMMGHHDNGGWAVVQLDMRKACDVGC